MYGTEALKALFPFADLIGISCALIVPLFIPKPWSTSMMSLLLQLGPTLPMNISYVLAAATKPPVAPDGVADTSSLEAVVLPYKMWENLGS